MQRYALFDIMATQNKEDKEAIRLLKEVVRASKKAQNPHKPDYLISVHEYEDRTANGLTRCVIDFLNHTVSCHAERISSEGRVIDGRKTFTDVMGNQRTIGSIKRIKSSGQLGTADISATILGRSVKIEIKVGNDRQSEHQKDYQRCIENAKGYYVIVRKFSEFLTWFNAKYPK